MNKLAIAFVALASCALATEIFYPKTPDCTFSAKLNATMNTLNAGGHLYGVSKGDQFYYRQDIIANSFPFYTIIIRCDKKQGENCSAHEESMGACTDSYRSAKVEFVHEFDYDQKESTPCPFGKGECTKYTHTADEEYIIVDSEKRIIVHHNVEPDGGIYHMEMEWLKDERFSMNKFDVTTCKDSKKMPSITNPCGDDYSSSASPAPKSESSSSSSMVKASFVLALAAVVAALF